MSKFYTFAAKRGNNILHVEYQNGERIVSQDKFMPTVFIPSKKESEWKSLFGQNLNPIQPGTIKETEDFVKQNSVDNFKILYNTDITAQFLAEKYRLGCIDSFDMSMINITSIDIEVASDEGFPKPDNAAQEVTAISMKDYNSDYCFSFGLGEYDAPKNVIYDKSVTEKELLLKFVHHWAKHCPDIITGWYIKHFDIPYLVNRIAKILGEDYLKYLSLFKLLPYFKQDKDGKTFYEIPGTTTMDYMEVFKKFGFTYGPQENNKLDTVALTILGESKLDYSEYADLNELYFKNHQKFMDYNVHDVMLIDRMEQSSGLLRTALTLAYKANCTYDATFGTVRIWDTFIYNILLKKKIVQPEKSDNMFRSIEGGYVKEPRTGMHDWCVSLDLNSLYPHLIMQYNMSPETKGPMMPGVSPDIILNGNTPDIPEGYSVAANGQTFKNDKHGIFPSIVEKLYTERSDIKKKMISTSQEIELLKKELRELT